MMPSNEPESPERPKEENIWNCSEILRKDKPTISERNKGLHELAFEAKSLKDTAWFDVASFTSYRVNNSGELEVRVRFSGFGKEEDEWVTVKDGVRERSIPLVPSECQKVKVGDHVLCFQERDYHALYIDANIVGIQRKLHDATECTCIFTVCYHFDNSEEEVHLKRICRRPIRADSPPVDFNSQNRADSPPVDFNLQNQTESSLDEKWKLSFLY